MEYQEILYDVKDRIATVTLNRPEKLNAWTRTIDGEVYHAMTAASSDADVRVVVLTGAGRGFCAGADMNLLQSINAENGGAQQRQLERPVGPIEGGLDLPEGFSRRYGYFPTVPKPVIAAINGPAAGLGFILALYADLRFASETAIFTTAFSRRGLIAEHGVDWMLPRIVGFSRATDLLLSARTIDAQEALGMGLVNQVYPQEELMERVRAYAGELVQSVSPRSMRVMKEQLYRTQFQSLEDSVAIADREMEKSFTSDDFREGVAHFVEKRPPAFTGA